MPDKRYRWRPEYATGIPGIDEEHRTFLALINRMAACTADQRPVCDAILTEIQHYAAYHFRSEEALMQEQRYPFLPRHRNEHRALVAEMAERLADWRDGSIAVHDLEVFLVHWFITHTRLEDQCLARYLGRPGQ